MDSGTYHTTEELLNKFEDNHVKYRIIPPGLTSYCQPLDLWINKPFKDLLKKNYRKFYIDNKKNIKPTPEELINWVAECWWSNDITESMIKLSFKRRYKFKVRMAQKIFILNGLNPLIRL